MSTTAAAVNQPASPAAAVSTFTLALLCACFVLSGFAALIYQTAWMRQFAIVFGTSELAVATVLAAYMAGLALGAWLAERFLPRVDRPVMTYALLELGIAAGAVLAVPALLFVSTLGLQALFGGQASPPSSDHAATTLFYLLSAFVALALPTTLMGATLPLLARYAVSEEKQIGRRIGALYAMNTAGAVAGALVTAFVLLPMLGLSHTTYFAAAVNALVFILAVMLAKRVPYTPPPKGYELDGPAWRLSMPKPVRTQTFRDLPGPAWVLPLMLAAGAVAFFQEVLWSRMFAHVMGSSIYAFGVMVASFLTGIALGGGLGAAVARSRETAAAALGAALIVAAFAAGVAYLKLESLLPGSAGLMKNVRAIAGVELPMNALLAGLLLLPMTVAIGMTYPLAVRVLANDAADAAPASARVYAWNTVGAIVGSLAAGFVLIPALKYEGAIRVAVWASAALGVAALWLVARVNRPFAAVATLLALVTLGFQPQPPMKLLVTSPMNVGTTGRVLSYDIGRSASVVMLSKDGELELRTNGLPEAIMDGTGSLPRFSGEYWLTPIAAIARPAARDMLVVGFGGGVVIENVPPSIERVDVIELEPKVIEANAKSVALRRRNPLGDSRVNIVLNDARGALQLTRKKYDAIVSQPSHPWTAGASHLYTREFMQLAHEHLNPDGVFVQWMNVIFMDADVLRSLTATLLDVYKEVRVYRPDPNTLLLLASDAPLNLETNLATTGEPLRSAPLHYQRFGINNAEDLVSALYLDTAGARRFAADAPIITDDDNRMATSSVYERSLGLNGDSSGRLLAGEDPLRAADSFVYRDLRTQLDFPYIARRTGVFSLLDPSLADRVGAMASNLGDEADADYVKGFWYRTRGQNARAAESLRLSIDEHPGDARLRAEFLGPWLPQIVQGNAPPEIAEVAAGLDARGKFLVDTLKLAAKSEWLQVARADEQLATIAWTDEWFAEANDLRINWRVRVTNPAQQAHYAEEALRMIDRVCLLNPTLGLYGYRVRAGFAMQRPDIVLESVASYSKFAAALVRSRVKTVETLRSDQKALTAILDDAAKLSGVDAARLGEVRGAVADLAKIG
ncbi:MAG TPA: fused MFS/spermidine synthase [Steroidobacteraceae bacterium]|nr:fused MFS/spermidine synthase [Steroidobacteraceae bacterium]